MLVDACCGPRAQQSRSRQQEEEEEEERRRRASLQTMNSLALIQLEGAIKIDPMDPWPVEVYNPPEHVYKLRCKRTGYLLTYPFEKNNPLPEAFDRTNGEYLVKLLDPVIKPKQTAETEAAKIQSVGAISSSSVVEEGIRSTSNKKNEKKQKKEKKAEQATTMEEEEPFQKANLRVGRIIEAKEDDQWSEKLYKCKVLCGEDEEKDLKQIVTGLRKFVKKEDLEGKMVLTIVNLKTAKLAGETSEAMILATESGVGDSVDVKLVKVPEGAKCGDRVFIEGSESPDAYPKECKSKIWEGIKASLIVKDGKATYNGKNLVVSSGGFVTSDFSVSDGAIIK